MVLSVQTALIQMQRSNLSKNDGFPKACHFPLSYRFGPVVVSKRKKKIFKPFWGLASIHLFSSFTPTLSICLKNKLTPDLWDSLYLCQQLVSLDVFLARFLSLCSGTLHSSQVCMKSDRLYSLPSLGTNSFSCKCGLDTCKGCLLVLIVLDLSVALMPLVLFSFLNLSFLLTSVTSVSSYSCPTVQSTSQCFLEPSFSLSIEKMSEMCFFYSSSILRFCSSLTIWLNLMVSTINNMLMGLNFIFIGQIFHELLIHKSTVHLLLSDPISASNSKYPRLNSPFCKTVPFLIFLLSLNSITTYIAPKTEAWETILAPSTPWHHISEVTMSYEFYLLVILEAIPINSNCQCFNAILLSLQCYLKWFFFIQSHFLQTTFLYAAITVFLSYSQIQNYPVIIL